MTNEIVRKITSRRENLNQFLYKEPPFASPELMREDVLIKKFVLWSDSCIVRCRHDHWDKIFRLSPRAPFLDTGTLDVSVETKFAGFP